jgi:hypothetical protein
MIVVPDPACLHDAIVVALLGHPHAPPLPLNPEPTTTTSWSKASCASVPVVVAINSTSLVSRADPVEPRREAWQVSPSRPRRTAGEQNTTHDQEPDHSDDGRDEPRVDAVRRPESATNPGRTAGKAENDGRYPNCKQLV